MKRLLYVLVFMPLLGFAEDKDYSIIPLAAYEFVSLENRQYHAPGIGLVFMKRDSLMIAAFYQSYLFKENQGGYPRLYHNVTAMVERKIQRHQILGIFRSPSDEPVYGGLRTFQAALGYGYELVRNNALSLTLGAAVGVSEFDIGGDITVPVFPFPLVRFGFTSSWLNVSFDSLRRVHTLCTLSRASPWGGTKGMYPESNTL